MFKLHAMTRPMEQLMNLIIYSRMFTDIEDNKDIHTYKIDLTPVSVSFWINYLDDLTYILPTFRKFHLQNSFLCS